MRRRGRKYGIVVQREVDGGRCRQIDELRQSLSAVTFQGAPSPHADMDESGAAIDRLVVQGLHPVHPGMDMQAADQLPAVPDSAFGDLGFRLS